MRAAKPDIYEKARKAETLRAFVALEGQEIFMLDLSGWNAKKRLKALLHNVK